MLLNVVLGGFAVLAIIVTLWSLAVAFSPHTTSGVRKDAMTVFHIAWKTAIAAVAITLVRLYVTGAFNTVPATVTPPL